MHKGVSNTHPSSDLSIFITPIAIPFDSGSNNLRDQPRRSFVRRGPNVIYLCYGVIEIRLMPLVSRSARPALLTTSRERDGTIVTEKRIFSKSDRFVCSGSGVSRGN